jgi:hypothetical protein
MKPSIYYNDPWKSNIPGFPCSIKLSIRMEYSQILSFIYCWVHANHVNSIYISIVKSGFYIKEVQLSGVFVNK